MANDCFDIYCLECNQVHKVPADVFGSIEGIMQGEAVKQFVQCKSGVYVITMVKGVNSLADYKFVGKPALIE